MSSVIQSDISVAGTCLISLVYGSAAVSSDFGIVSRLEMPSSLEVDDSRHVFCGRWVDSNINCRHHNKWGASENQKSAFVQSLQILKQQRVEFGQACQICSDDE